MRHKAVLWAGRALLLFVIAVFLQTVVVSHISILGVSADLFLVLTVLVALGRGSMEGAVFGFLAGIVQDTVFFQPLGVHALILVLVGHFVGTLPGRLGTINMWVVLAITAVSSFLGQVVFGLFMYMMGPRAAFFTMMGTQMIPEGLFDALIAIPIYMLLIRARVLPALRSESAATRSSSE